MSEPSYPEGQLFSQIYVQRGKPVADSFRFRKRLGRYLDVEGHYYGRYLANMVGQQIGDSPTRMGSERYNWSGLISQIEIEDLLDVITVLFKGFVAKDDKGSASAFRIFVARALREENLGYRVDDKGGVHFYVDEEFEASRSATLAAIAGDDAIAARQAMEDAHAALRAGDTLLAVRRAFDAVENRFKIDYGVSRLGASEVKQKLPAIVTARYEGRVTDAANRMIAAFAEWTNAAHNFRHAPGTADPAPPPQDLALLMVSEAMAYVRWLVSLKAG